MYSITFEMNLFTGIPKHILHCRGGHVRGHVSAVSGPCQGHVSAVSGPCQGHVSAVSGPCQGHVRGIVCGHREIVRGDVGAPVYLCVRLWALALLTLHLIFTLSCNDPCQFV